MDPIYKSGIYKITNIINNKIYIGSAVCFYTRWANHRSTLKRNKHDNQHLQNSYNKYGDCVFTYSILLLCKKKDLIIKEQYFIDSLKPEYNICKIAHSTLGQKCSEETKKKISNSLTGRKPTQETREKLSKARSGSKNPQFGKIGNLSAVFGKSLTEEHKQKISVSHASENAPLVKLTWDQVREIRNFIIASPITYKELAKKYNVSKTTIYDIITYRTWKIR